MNLSAHIRIVLCLLSAGIPLCLYGQDPDEQSLEAQLERQERDDDYMGYAETVQELGGILAHRGATNEAIALYDHAAAVCHEHRLYKWFAIFKRNISEIGFMTDRREEALALLDSLAQLPEIPEEEMTAIYYRLGDIYCDQGNYDTGIPMLERSLELAGNSGYEVLLGSIYTELGLAENQFGSKIKAIDYLIKAIPQLSEPRHSGVLCHNYLTLSDLFDETGQRSKADEYLDKAREIIAGNAYHRLYHRVLYKDALRDLERKDPAGIAKLKEVLSYQAESDLPLQEANVALDIAAAYIDFNQPEDARSYLDRGWEKIRNQKPSIQHAKYYEYLTRYWLIIGDLQKARTALIQNKAVSMLGGHILQGRTMALEVDVLSAEGRYGDALALNDRHHRFQDSLNSIQQNQVLFDIEARYQKEEREREIALLSAQNEIKDLTIQRSERQRLMLLLGLLAFALITGTALYTYRAKQRLNQQLVEKNTLVTNSLAEKELLLKEIHHRVKNNLEIISGLLYLQSKYVEDENVLEAIREGQNRVRSMSLIHKNLYQEENLTGISIQAYLDKLVDGLMKSYKVGTNHIDIRKDIARLNLDVDTAIPLALIINELISNALKYAFPGDRPGTMCISLHELDNELVLNVEDDGVGLPEDFNIGESHSLGFRLVDMFTQKLEGVLQISGDHGTRVTLRIAKYKVV